VRARQVRSPVELKFAPDQAPLASPRTKGRLMRWIADWANGRAGQIVGVYAPEAFAYRVVQQPRGQPIFVSREPEALTQFRRANELGSLGMLAHNTLAGADFYALKPGATAFVVYGDGSYEAYRVEEIEDYHAINLYLYQDLETNRRLNDVQLLETAYSGNGDRLVLQTCIARDGAPSWGRRFVIARLVERGESPQIFLNPLPIIPYQ
jgi:hypothetical protein